MNYPPIKAMFERMEKGFLQKYQVGELWSDAHKGQMYFLDALGFCPKHRPIFLIGTHRVFSLQ